MSILSNTRLEDWGEATTNLAGLLNSNQLQLELIFNPVASSHLYDGTAADVGNLHRDSLFRNGNETLSGTTPDIDFVLQPVQKHVLTGATTYTVSNATQGKFVWLWIVADGSLRTLAWPGSIIFVGPDPGGTIQASKNALVKLHCVDTTGPVILAEFLAEL